MARKRTRGGEAVPLGTEIARLRDLDRQALRARWQAVVGRPAPEHLPPHLLVRVLAYRLQARAFGDLSPATGRLLGRIATGAALPPPVAARLTPGTVLVREVEGTPERVMVVEDGFAWRGATYQSLSEVARAMTGTRWNGPRFFGLRDGAGE